MSRAVKQPVGQKRLTNVAVVRLKKNGKRFEVACYRNKINDWRAGIEKDIDEVLQTTTVFANVGKGVHAKREDLVEAFGTADEERVCREILAKGDVQVSDRERRAELDALFKDVAQVLAEKTVNPDNGRPYTHTVLERALRDLHFNPDLKKSAKQQAIEALPLLQKSFRIERARMRLKLTAPESAAAPLRALLAERGAVIEGEAPVVGGGGGGSSGGATALTGQVEPGVFRDLHAFMQAEAGREGRVEVLSFAVTAEGAGGADYGSALAAAAAVAAVSDQQQQQGEAGSEPSSSSDASAAAAAAAQRTAAAAARRAAVAAASDAGSSGGGGAAGTVVYARGPVADLPDEYASRRERFSELDALQPGWLVELAERGGAVDAVFYSPAGARVGPFAAARRAALAWRAAQQQQ